MKILYIITQADGGGAQKYVLSLAQYFKGTIASGRESDKLFEDAKILGIKTFTLRYLKRNINPIYDLLAAWEMRGLVKTLKPDIVHLNSSKAGILGSLACFGLKAKVVFTAHGFVFNEPMPFWRKKLYFTLEKLASKFRDFIITVSDADKNSAVNLIKNKKIQTVYNGIRHIDFYSREEARKKLNIPAERKMLVVIANDYKTKGLNIVKKAMEINPFKDVYVGIIGKTSDCANSNDRVVKFGYIKNAEKYLKAFDGTIIPSRKEGFPFFALEAMQAGQPIISTNVGGLPEALQDAAILIPPDNPEILNEKIIQEFRDKTKLRQLSQKALERSKLFTEEKMLEETKLIYQKLLA